MRKSFLLAAIATFALAVAAPAQADTILFDPDGGGDSFFAIDAFDWAPGSGIAVGASAGSTDPFTFFSQVHLASATVSGNIVPIYTTGQDGVFFTLVLGFGETVVSNTFNPVTGQGTLVFGFDDTNPVNFFQIYASTVAPNPLDGTDFVSGTLILSGQIVEDPLHPFISSFTVDSTAAGANLDQFGGDDYPTVDTVTGSGSTLLSAEIFFADGGWFQGLGPGSVITFFNNDATQTVPFDAVDPSSCFFADSRGGTLIAPTCLGTGGSTGVTPFTGVGSVGAINGLGSNTMLEIDGNSSFETAQNVIPEPATLTLLGFGLMGAAAARRRQLRNKK